VPPARPQTGGRRMQSFIQSSPLPRDWPRRPCLCPLKPLLDCSTARLLDCSTARRPGFHRHGYASVCTRRAAAQPDWCHRAARQAVKHADVGPHCRVPIRPAAQRPWLRSRTPRPIAGADCRIEWGTALSVHQPKWDASHLLLRGLRQLFEENTQRSTEAVRTAATESGPWP
jgi:hypothetical protein